MKSSKGITMASLVVMIASIILLSTMAIGFGYKYLKETKEADDKYFTEVLSNAVIKRENNYTVNSIEYPRAGYYINSSEIFKEILTKYMPQYKNNSELLYDRGLWYIVDTNAANKLGVRESDKYIDIFDKDKNEKMTLALVDYYSGTVWLFEINGLEIADLEGGLSGDSFRPTDDHEHDFNLEHATCTEDKKCLICGLVVEVAKGHTYEGGIPYKWIDDEFHYNKECVVCHMIGGYERHKNLDGYAFYQSGDGTWYHYTGCSVCGWPGDVKDYESCDIIWQSISDSKHVKKCRICEHEEEFLHEFKYAYVDQTYHEQVCTVCGYVRIKFEPHEDNDDDGYCDKCGGEIIKGEEPILEYVNIMNKEYNDSNFVTNDETIKLTFKSDKRISESKVTICGYGGDYIKYTYSADKKTCVVELLVDADIVIAQNTEVTFTINCKSESTGKWMLSAMTATTDGSYLIYDSVPPEIEYILKETY